MLQNVRETYEHVYSRGPDDKELADSLFTVFEERHHATQITSNDSQKHSYLLQAVDSTPLVEDSHKHTPSTGEALKHPSSPVPVEGHESKIPTKV